MAVTAALSDTEIDEINAFLARVDGGDIPNIELLDGFLVAAACASKTVKLGECIEVIQKGASAEGDLTFGYVDEGLRFMELIQKHYSHVNSQMQETIRLIRVDPMKLLHEDFFEPMLFPDGEGVVRGNDWAKGFVRGTKLRQAQWAELFIREEIRTLMMPIWALAHEEDPDPELRSYDEPVSDELRKKLIVGITASALNLYRYIHGQNGPKLDVPTNTFTRSTRKTGRNDPCPCGSGLKFKKCCGQQPTFH